MLIAQPVAGRGGGGPGCPCRRGWEKRKCLSPVSLLTRQKSPGPALCAALGKLLRDSVRALDAFHENPAVRAHFLRTRVKRLQSLSRLAPEGRKWRESFLPPLCQLKDLFAETRDATIVLALASKYAPGEAQHLRVASPPDLVGARHLAELASGLLHDYPGWEKIEWSDVADRAAGTYRAARKAWKGVVSPGAADAAFHGWRRRVKRLLYQCEYLGGQAHLVRLTRRVDKLGEILGEIQDICMAEDWLGRQHGLAVPADLPRRRAALRRRALRSGEALLSLKPRDFRKMLG